MTIERRIGVLDGLRAIAVLEVVGFHAGVLPWGGFGIDLFLVLSGFLITRSLLEAKERGGRGWATYVKPWYMRRSLRIFPLAYAVLALILVVAPAIGMMPSIGTAEQLGYWLFVSNWWPKPHSAMVYRNLSHLWSLALQEQFYLLWPWMVLAVERRTLLKVSVALAISAIAVRSLLLVYPILPQVGHLYEQITIARMDQLAIGAILAIVLMEQPNVEGWARRAALSFVVSGVCFVVLKSSMFPDWVGYLLRFPTVSLVTAAGIVFLLARPESAASRIVGHPALRWIGTVSYGIYLTHYPITNNLRHHGVQPAANAFVTLAIALALATLSWYWFEKPTMKFAKARWPMRPESIPTDVRVVTA